MQDEERGLGELAGQLIDDAKAYGRAEVDLIKARAEGQVERARRPAILGGIALALALAGTIALIMTLVLWLGALLGPLGGGLTATALTFALSGGLAWWAVRSWKAGA